MNPSFRNKFDFILKRHFLISPSNLKGRRYLDDLGLTKLEQREMLNYFEDEFQIQFSEQDERKIRTVHDTLSILDKYLNINNQQLKAS
jgi:acyl carrier protein